MFTFHPSQLPLFDTSYLVIFGVWLPRIVLVRASSSEDFVAGECSDMARAIEGDAPAFLASRSMTRLWLEDVPRSPRRFSLDLKTKEPLTSSFEFDTADYADIDLSGFTTVGSGGLEVSLDTDPPDSVPSSPASSLLSLRLEDRTQEGTKKALYSVTSSR